MHPKLQHRGGLAYMVKQLNPSPTLFHRVGGQDTIDELVDGLYDGIESDEYLLPFFKHDLAVEREKQKSFFARWMGSDVVYDGYRGVRAKHRELVTKEGARRWLGHFSKAAKSTKMSSALVKELMDVVVPLAHALVDDKPMLQCQAWYRKPAADVAKGSLQLTQDWLVRYPELLEPGPAQLLLHYAIRKGQLETVKYLCDQGVDVNLPDCTQHGIAVTPLCLALSQKHLDVATFLIQRGAEMDIFTLAWLGELEQLKTMVSSDPEVLDICDPAQDFQEVTPLEHALYRNKLKVAEYLLDSGASLHKGDIYLDRAVSKRRIPMAKLLLERGVCPRTLGPGRWVNDEKLFPLLSQYGASVKGDSSEWIEFCTGHHGNPERPELILKLLDEGVNLHGRAPKGRTALHCATRVGYTKVMEILLQRGIDVDAQDESGNTALHYVFMARGKVDRRAVAEMLLRYGADSGIPNNGGDTFKDRALRVKELKELF